MNKNTKSCAKEFREEISLDSFDALHLCVDFNLYLQWKQKQFWECKFLSASKYEKFERNKLSDWLNKLFCWQKFSLKKLPIFHQFRAKIFTCSEANKCLNNHSESFNSLYMGGTTVRWILKVCAKKKSKWRKKCFNKKVKEITRKMGNHLPIAIMASFN